MAWENSIDRSSSLFSMFKPERPLIDIPPASHHSSAAAHGHVDPLRTPEDIPLRHQHPPWYAAHIDDMCHFTPFALDDEHAHMHTGFPDVEDAGWALGVSPPSPSRRTMEMLPDLDDVQVVYDDADMEGPPMLSPPSPSRRSHANLSDAGTDTSPGNRLTEHAYHVYPNEGIDMDDQPALSPPSPSRRSLTLLPETDWQPELDDCPQLSPPSPIHCSSALPPLVCEFDTHPLFIEDTLPSSTISPVYSHPYSPSPLAARLRTEHLALLSLRDRTMHAERTSRARNVALRGRERELGRAVAALREAHAHSASATIPLGDDPGAFFNMYPSALGAHPPDTPLPTPTAALHAYRTLATRVMLERTEEKRRRKKDKEKLKELRVVLGPGVDALLGLAGDGDTFPSVTDADLSSNLGDLGPAQRSATRVTMDLGKGCLALRSDTPTVILHPSESTDSSLAFAEHAIDVPIRDEEPCIAPRETFSSASGLGLDLSFECSAPSPFSELAERTHAMRRLVARMTMRRRDLGMRSLIEAGNMSGAEGEAGGVDGGNTNMATNKRANTNEKPGRAGSTLARVVVGAEDLDCEDVAQEDGAQG